jgi:predicted nucleic acid-binding protein
VKVCVAGDGEMLKIYLDNCCYGRPFDGQSNTVVKMETQAKLFIQSLVKYGYLNLVHSFVLNLEIDKNLSAYKRENIRAFLTDQATEYVGSENRAEVVRLASEIMKTGIKTIDAAHVACAIISQCDYFVSTDRRLLRYKTDYIKLLNPIEFVKIWEGNSSE